MSFVIDSPSESPVRGRLRQGSKDHPTVTTHAVDSTDGSPDSSRGYPGHQDVDGQINMLLSVLTQQKGSAIKPELVTKLLQTLQQKLSTKATDITPPDRTISPDIDQDTGPILSSTHAVPQQPLLVTPLGRALIKSSDEPIAALGKEPPLTTRKTTTTLQHVQPQTRAVFVSPVDGTAPKSQPHAQIWQDVIAAGRNGGSLSVDGQTTAAPSLVMTDVTGNIVKVPLTTAVDAKSTTIITQSAFITSAVSTAPRSLARMRTTTQPAKTTTVIPHILLASNLAGNEENTVPSGFVLAGDIKLFGGLNAELYTFHGTAGDEKSAMVMLSQSPVSMDAVLASPGVVLSLIHI